MATVKLFDLDQSLKEDPTTKDFKELYNKDVVNQSIDIFLSNPYRIGVGLSNRIFDSVFADMNGSTDFELSNSLKTSFANDYPFIQIQSLKVTTDPTQRRLKIQMIWNIPNFQLTGDYTRFWST